MTHTHARTHTLASGGWHGMKAVVGSSIPACRLCRRADPCKARTPCFREPRLTAGRGCWNVDVLPEVHREACWTKQRFLMCLCPVDCLSVTLHLFTSITVCLSQPVPLFLCVWVWGWGCVFVCSCNVTCRVVNGWEAACPVDLGLVGGSYTCHTAVCLYACICERVFEPSHTINEKFVFVCVYL